MVIVIFEKESNRFLSLFPQFSQIEDNIDTIITFPLTSSIKKITIK